MQQNRRILVGMAYAIVLTFVVSGFATVVTLPRNVSDGVEKSGVSTLPSAQAYWDMSTLRNGKLQNLADSTGATDGTLYNTVPSSSGAVGASMDFNGNSAAVDSPDPNNRLKSDSGTVSAWIKSTGKPAETTKLRAAIVIVENGVPANQSNKDFLGLLGPAATDIYSQMVHGHGTLEVSTTIYVQTAVAPADLRYPHLVELNNFIALGNPDIYDYICFFPTNPSVWQSCMMNFKNTIHGIGQPYMWYDDIGNTTTVDDTEPNSSYITCAAVLSGYIPTTETQVAHDAYIFVHEMCHAWCAFWSYEDGGTVKAAPVSGYHYHAQFRTDLHSTLGGMGWRDNHNGTWTDTAFLDPAYNMNGVFDDTEYNLDEYTIGLIPASEVVPSHLLLPDRNYSYGLPMERTITATDSEIPIANITSVMGPWWNEEDRQAVMLRCTNTYGDVFGGQGWGLFVGTVAPNDHVYWYSGSADGAVEWRNGNARVCDGAWHNLAVSYTGTTGRLYVDGVLDIQWTIHAVAAANNVHTVIGCEDPTNPYFESWFSGSIDDVYVFNTVLTDWQIGEIYDARPSTPGIPHLQTPGDESDGTFTLTWTASVDMDLTPVEGYYVGESTYLGSGTWSAWQMVGGPISSTSITLTRVPGSYIYRVCAFDTADWYSGWAAMDQLQPIVVPQPPSPPVTTANVTGTVGLNGWYISAVTVTLTATDPDGVSATYYKIDAARRWTTYKNPFSVPNGKHVVTFYSVDKLGYQETPAKTIDVWVDPLVPSTTATLNSKKLTVTLTVSDVPGAVVTSYYQLDGGAWNVYTGPVKTTRGSHTISYYSVDQAGWTETTRILPFTF